MCAKRVPDWCDEERYDEDLGKAHSHSGPSVQDALNEFFKGCEGSGGSSAVMNEAWGGVGR